MVSEAPVAFLRAGHRRQPRQELQPHLACARPSCDKRASTLELGARGMKSVARVQNTFRSVKLGFWGGAWLEQVVPDAVSS